MTDQQPVVEDVDTEAKPESETQDAREENNLETLLAEFDSSTPEPTPDKVETDELAILKRQVHDLQISQTLEKDQADFGKLTDRLIGNRNISERLAKGFVRDYVADNPKMEDAFNKRNENPQAYNKMIEILEKEFGNEWSNSGIDAQATEDREAVSAAVRGSSTSAPTDGPAPDYSNMSDAEYREAIHKEHGFTPL